MSGSLDEAMPGFAHDARLSSMTEPGVSKVHAFAAFAEDRGWIVAVRSLTHRDYPDKRNRQAGWTAVARRGDEVLTATWIDEVAIGPIGGHSTPDTQLPIANQASPRRIIEA